MARFPPQIPAARDSSLCQIARQASDSACFYFASCEDFGVACGRTVLLYWSPPPHLNTTHVVCTPVERGNSVFISCAMSCCLAHYLEGSPSVVLYVVERVNTSKRTKNRKRAEKEMWGLRVVYVDAGDRKCVKININSGGGRHSAHSVIQPGNGQ